MDNTQIRRDRNVANLEIYNVGQLQTDASRFVPIIDENDHMP